MVEGERVEERRGGHRSSHVVGLESTSTRGLMTWINVLKVRRSVVSP